MAAPSGTRKYVPQIVSNTIVRPLGPNLQTGPTGPKAMQSANDRRLTATASITNAGHGNQGQRQGVPLFATYKGPDRTAGSKLRNSPAAARENSGSTHSSAARERGFSAGEHHQGATKNRASIR